MVVLRACQYVCDVERRVKATRLLKQPVTDCDEEKLI